MVSTISSVPSAPSVPYKVIASSKHSNRLTWIFYCFLIAIKALYKALLFLYLMCTETAFEAIPTTALNKIPIIPLCVFWTLQICTVKEVFLPEQKLKIVLLYC